MRFVDYCRYFLIPLCCFACLAIYCVSIATTNWKHKEDGNITTISGLWKTCNTSISDDSYQCYIAHDTIHTHGWMKICRTGAALGIVCCLLTTVFSILFSRKPSRVKHVLLVFLHMIGSSSFALTLILYAAEFKNDSHSGSDVDIYFQLGWSYILGCVGILSTLCTIILTVIIYRFSIKQKHKDKKRITGSKRLMVEMTDEGNEFYWFLISTRL